MTFARIRLKEALRNVKGNGSSSYAGGYGVKDTDPSRKYFDESLSDRERAVFEGGIALATAYHQFVGTPLRSDERFLTHLRGLIERVLKVQPFRTDSKVRLSVSKEEPGAFAYTSLSGKMFDVSVTIRYGEATATCRLRYIDELSFPLMYVERVEDSEATHVHRRPS